MKHINIGDLLNYTVPLPATIAEQEAIANALSDADAYIESLEKLIDKKRQIKKGTMQELLTGKRRLPGFSGRWHRRVLGESCSLITKGTTPTSIGAEFTSSGVGFIKIESITPDGQISPDLIGYISSQTHQLLCRSQLKAGDLLISIAGALGRGALVTEEFLPANTNQALAILRFSDKSNLCKEFVFHFLKTTEFKTHIEAISVQGAQANLSLGDISKLHIVAPPMDEQTAIASLLDELEIDIRQTEIKLSKARLIKQGMMQELLTGRIRLV
jgi:type I restriction enzyme S subunit